MLRVAVVGEKSASGTATGVKGEPRRDEPDRFVQLLGLLRWQPPAQTLRCSAMCVISELPCDHLSLSGHIVHADAITSLYVASCRVSALLGVLELMSNTVIPPTVRLVGRIACKSTTSRRPIHKIVRLGN